MYNSYTPSCLKALNPANPNACGKLWRRYNVATTRQNHRPAGSTSPCRTSISLILVLDASLGLYEFAEHASNLNALDLNVDSLGACSLVAKVHDWDPEGWWFKPQCSHDKIHAAVGPLSKALNATLLQWGLPPAWSNQLKVALDKSIS